MARQTCVCVSVCVRACVCSAKSCCLIQLLDVTSIISPLKLICPKKRQLQLTCQSGLLDITVWKK